MEDERSSRGAAEVGSAPRYSIYGLTLATDFPFTYPLPPASGEPDLELHLASAPPGDLAGPGAEPVWESPERPGGAPPLTRLDRLKPGWRLRFHEAGSFYLGAGRIVVVPGPGDSSELVELRLLGPVLAFWLELRGMPVLHASAVVAAGRALALAGGNHAGKSSLAAALMRRGMPLLTDDVLPVERVSEEGSPRFVARPGYPQMRFWPEDAARLSPAAAELPRVHPTVSKRRLAVGEDGFGTFTSSPVPLGGLLILDRGAAGAEMATRQLPPSRALVELLRLSFVPNLVVAAGLQPGRLARLAELVEAQPVTRLTYPGKLSALDGVAERVAALAVGQGEVGRK